MIASPSGATMSRADAEALVQHIAETAWRDWQKACHRYEGPGAYTVVALNVHTREQHIFGSSDEFEAANHELRRGRSRASTRTSQ